MNNTVLSAKELDILRLALKYPKGTKRWLAGEKLGISNQDFTEFFVKVGHEEPNVFKTI
jgi:hypothetical protein